MKSKAEWENKTDTVIEEGMVKKKVEEFKKQHEQQLELRRQRLVELLTEEEKKYEQEFFANLETPEQVREKMAKRLHELRSKREQERKDEVDRKLDVRFKKAADDLRKLDAQFIATSTKLDQEQQMLEKVARKQAEMEGIYITLYSILLEEVLYSQLWQTNLLQKQKRELEEVQERKRQIEERMKVLDWQKETREKQKQEGVRNTKKEKEMLKQQWKEEDQRAKAENEQKLQRMRELNLELIKHNELEKELKDKMAALEKERDKAMVNEIVEINKKQAEMENSLRDKRMTETKETLKVIGNKAEIQKQEEHLIEKLAEEERKRQMEREDEKWKKEQDAKVALLKDVYEDRAKAIEYKSKLN